MVRAKKAGVRLSNNPSAVIKTEGASRLGCQHSFHASAYTDLLQRNASIRAIKGKELN